MNASQKRRYDAAVHSYQSAIAYQIEHLGLNGAGADPKHLRVGVNSAMADHGAITKLLIEKGVFTEAEYFEAVVFMAEQEASLLTTLTRSKLGLSDSVSFG